MYKLSIIIPIYKVENYIQECLQSVLYQLPDNVQIICVNDGSPDNSINIAKNLLKSYSQKVQSQFIFIDQPNQGLSGARNTGLEYAKGEYIGFLDSDDKLNDNYFDSILSILEKENYDIIDFNVITSKGDILRTRKVTYDSVFSVSKWFCPARVFKANLFHNTRFTIGISYEDVDLTPKLYLAANSTYHIDAPLYWYRHNEESITKSFTHKNNVQTIESLDYICDNYLNLYEESENPYYAIVAIQSYYLLCISVCRRFNLIKALHYIRKYEKRMHSIDTKQLPIERDVIHGKVLALYRHPRAFCSVYILYDRLRTI
ncbi:glycosyltransferase family 2 protein [Psychrobacter sp. UBA3962]|uniref:glycosyltransferase family 2 protein n=1 Tax=Psychrobacter sp. UBA3962 TaxID=1947352 RepID=UPI0025EE35B3|nr:glycosyltransferase family 2 protein [Psychrobacter sp. UBA3962]